MVAGFEQRPWTPTIRRGQISAETTTPGPAAVALPSLLGSRSINLSIYQSINQSTELDDLLN